MFVLTVINFLLLGLAIGIAVTIIVFFRMALTLDIEFPLSERRAVVNKVLQNLIIVDIWSANLPVSSNLSLLDSMSIHALMLGEGIIQRSHCYLEGLGSLPKSTMANPHTIYAVDRNRG